MYKCSVASLLLLSSFSFAAYEIPKESLQTLGDAKGFSVFKEPAGFFAKRNNENYYIPFSPTALKTMDEETLSKYLAANYLILKRNGGHFTLASNGRLKGSGPFTGLVAGFTVWTAGTAAVLAITSSQIACGNLPGAYIAMVGGIQAVAGAGAAALAVGTMMPTP
jgi:hypothetical protein